MTTDRRIEEILLYFVYTHIPTLQDDELCYDNENLPVFYDIVILVPQRWPLPWFYPFLLYYYSRVNLLEKIDSKIPGFGGYLEKENRRAAVILNNPFLL